MFISQALAQTSEIASEAESSLFSFLPLILMVLMIYLFAMRPQIKHAKKTQGVDGLGGSWALALPRGDGDTVSRAEAWRDRLATRFRDLLPPGTALTTYESVRGNGSVWLRLELITPDHDRPELSLRTVLALTFERFDFHRFEHVIMLQIGRGLYRKTAIGLTDLPDDDVRSILAFATGTSSHFPRLKAIRLRNYIWQVWRPRNRISRLRRDWLMIGLNVSGASFVTVAIVALAASDSSGGGACGAIGACSSSGAAWMLGSALIGIAALTTSFVRLRRRCTLVLNTGKPKGDPRSLVRMDSWQVTLTGLGERQEEVQAAILNELRRHQPPAVTMQPEWIGYASVDSKVEREQHVVTFRRAMAFVRLEAYGNDLYLGWDSHINAGNWAEQNLSHGVDRVSGRPVVARRVVESWHSPSEYDLSDASFVTEWLHACIVRVVKAELANYRIDQEIDFSIQRESRADALRRPPPESDKRSDRFGFGRLRRAA